MRIAIVGSQGKYWTPAQRTKVIKKIHDIFMKHELHSLEGTLPFSRIVLLSGACGGTSEDKKQIFDGGVDVWAEIVADALGVKKDIKYAPAMQWEDKVVREGVFTPEHLQEEGRFSVGAAPIRQKGFKTRNLEIANDCDVLYCIEPIVVATSYAHAMNLSWSQKHQRHYRRSGGCWTMKEAEKLGKEVHLVLIE